MKYYDEDPGFRLIALDNDELKNRRIYVDSIWRPADKLHRQIGSRRNWLKEFERLDWLEDYILLQDGTPHRLDPAGYELFEFGNRWLSDFLRADASGRKPAKYKRHLEKLRRIHLVIELWKVEGKFPGRRPPG